MSRPLDFIVFGVPRSGTKGLAAALSLHPEVFCASERFNLATDHAAIRYPDSFVASADIRDRHNLAKAAAEADVIRARSGVRFAGNKLPRYYLALDRINRERPGLANLWIYRSPRGFIQSWNRKEAQHRTARWMAGQIGLFGVLELILCVDRVLALPQEVFVFPYDSGLNGSSAPLRNALAFIGANPHGLDEDRFAREILQRRRVNKRRIALERHEEAFLAAIDSDRLDALLLTDRGARVSELRSPLKAWLDSLEGRLPAAFDVALAASGNRAAELYGADFFHRHRAATARLARLLAGSVAAESFAHFGPLRRLRALIAQRAMIGRRLALGTPRRSHIRGA